MLRGQDNLACFREASVSNLRLSLKPEGAGKSIKGAVSVSEGDVRGVWSKRHWIERLWGIENLVDVRFKATSTDIKASNGVSQSRELIYTD